MIGRTPRTAAPRARLLAVAVAATLLLASCGPGFSIPWISLPSLPGPGDLGPRFHPSDDCAGGTVLLDGYLGDTYLKLRTNPDPDPQSDDRWVCVSLDDGTLSLGGRLVLAGSPNPPPLVREDTPADPVSAACATDPNNERVQAGSLLGQQYWIDVTPSPEDQAVLWACIRLQDDLGFRLEAHSTTGIADFEPDSPGSRVDRPGEPAWPAPAEPSADCIAASAGGTTRLANARVKGSEVALYSWQESPTRAHLCVRGLNAGGRLTVDSSQNAGVSPVLTSSTTDLSPCSFPIVTRDEPPPTFGLWLHEDPDHPAFLQAPPSACLTLGMAGARASVGASESALVEWHEDAQ